VKGRRRGPELSPHRLRQRSASKDDGSLLPVCHRRIADGC
jgi:hypothetical protein